MVHISLLLPRHLQTTHRGWPWQPCLFHVTLDLRSQLFGAQTGTSQILYWNLDRGLSIVAVYLKRNDVNPKPRLPRWVGPLLLHVKENGETGRPCLQRSKSGGRLEAWVCSVGTSNGAWLLEPGLRFLTPMLLITWLQFSLHCLHTSAWWWFRKHFCIYKIQNAILCVSILILSLLLTIHFGSLIEGGYTMSFQALVGFLF